MKQATLVYLHFECKAIYGRLTTEHAHQKQCIVVCDKAHHVLLDLHNLWQQYYPDCSQREFIDFYKIVERSIIIMNSKTSKDRTRSYRNKLRESKEIYEEVKRKERKNAEGVLVEERKHVAGSSKS